MLWSIFTFELNYYRKQPLFYVMAGIFFLLPFLITVSPNISIGLPNNILANSPFAIMSTLQAMSFIGLFACLSYAANPVLRDFETRSAELIFSTQIRKHHFLYARFLAALVFVLLILLASVMGVLAAELLPLIEPQRLGALRPDAYLFSFLYIMLPNAVAVCSFVFLVATLTRSLMAAYVVVLVLITLFSIIFALVDPNQLAMLSIVEPFGATALGEVTRYWTPHEQNALLPQLSGALLANRALWLTLALVALGLTYKWFPFSIEGSRRREKNHAAKTAPAAQAPQAFAHTVSNKVQPQFDRYTALYQWWAFACLEAKQVLTERLFIVIVLLGIFNVTGGLIGSTSDVFGVDNYPTMLLVLNVINGSFALPLLIVVVFYSAELVHREQQSGVASFLNALPFPNWTIVLAKLAALMMVITVMLLVAIATGIVYQLASGYFDINLAQYFVGLFLYMPFSIWLFAVLAIFLQVLIPQKYIAMFLTLLYFMSQIFLPQLGYDQFLYLYAIPAPAFSAFTGFELGLDAYAWFSLYWGAFALLLIVASQLLWRRSGDSQWRSRLRMARQRFSPALAKTLLVGALIFGTSGGFIYYNTNVLNTHYSLLDLQRLQSEYELAYKAHENIPQPVIEVVTVNVDIFPQEREAEISGRYLLRNEHDQPIDEVHVSLLPDITIEAITIEGATLSAQDSEHGHYVYTLAEALQPGQQLPMDFQVAWRTPGFVNRAPASELLSNGTFFDNTRVLPAIGYSTEVELLDNSIRHRNNLGDVQRAKPIDDIAAHQRTVIGTRRVMFEATLSTTLDQIAIAPGYLEKEWVDNNRRYFHYKMDQPIWNFFSFMSADYQVKKEQSQGVSIEAYYLHEVNVERMMASTKKSLAYFQANFSPYQYRQFRILEFPAMRGRFAQAFANTVPFAETIGFTADVRNPERIDMPFYVTAHELAHQWWGHQVAGADVQGGALIIESLAQYSALMVMQQEYGKPYMQRFLKLELDRYLNGRGGELLEELPLALVENQPYIHYRKGSLVLYALQDAVGENKVNAALAEFLADYAFQPAPYPTTRDLLARIRAHAGPEAQPLIDDLFDHIVIYDLKTEEARYRELDDGRYKVTLQLQAKKFHADGQGVETPVSINNHIDVAVLGESSSVGQPAEVLYLQKHHFEQAQTEITVTVDKLPLSAGIDPFNIMIDRLPDDNIKPITIEGPRYERIAAQH